MIDITNMISGIATVLGLFIVVWQIWSEGRKERTNFEDGFAREYRDLVAVLPLYAMLGKKPPSEFEDKDMLAFYRYFDLCNQQAFMFAKQRIGKVAWADWLEGIRDNLKLPAFTQAWNQIKESRRDSFLELRQLEERNFVLERHHPLRSLWARITRTSGGTGDTIGIKELQR